MTNMYYVDSRGELQHWGIKGQKWGVRKYQNQDGSLTPAGKKRYRSTSIKSAMAKRANKKVDQGFDKWKEGAQKRDNAIELGKKANDARLAYEGNKSDKALKTAYKEANKEYKKALGENTSYRKGTVRQKVGQDISRKYLSEAKKVGKQLDADPSNKALLKRYNELMSKHDIERANARKAQAVGEKRSRKKASIKRAMTMTATAIAGTAAVSAGVYAVNRYLNTHQVTVGGKRASVSTEGVSKVLELAAKAKALLGYMY